VPVAGLDTPGRPDAPRLGAARLLQGDCRQRDILEKADLAKARGVIIVTSDDLVNLSAALLVRSISADVRVVVRMFNQNLITRLGSAVRNVYPLSTSALSAPLLALIARTGEALGAFQQDGGTRQQIADFTAAPQSTFVGRPLGDIVREHQAVPIAHRPAGGDWRFLHELNEQAPLAAADRVIVCGQPKNLTPLVSKGENESLPELFMAGWTRRI